MQMTIEGSYIWTAEKDMIAHRSYTHRSIGFVDPSFTKRMLNQRNNKTWKILRVKNTSYFHRPSTLTTTSFPRKNPWERGCLDQLSGNDQATQMSSDGNPKKVPGFSIFAYFHYFTTNQNQIYQKLSRVARSVKHAQRAQKKERKRESHSKTREEKRSVLQGARMLGNHLL